MKCYLCNSQTQLFIRKSGYDIYRCDVCGLAMTDLNKNYDEFINLQYGKGYFTGDPDKRAYVSYEKDKSYILRNMNTLIQEILKYKSSGKLLDVGAAMGYFIELALDKGFDAYGFDPSSFAVHKAKTTVGERIKIGSVHSISYPIQSFDIITMLDVFEHLEDPIKDLRKLVSFLKDNGIVLIATGDTKSFIAKIIRRRWTFYNPPQHLFFFNQQTLSHVLSSANLKPIAWFRVGKWLSLEYVLHLASTLGESSLATTISKFISRTTLGRFPLYLPLGDNMVVIAKKNITSL